MTTFRFPSGAEIEQPDPESAARIVRRMQAQTLVNAVSEHYEVDASELSMPEFERLAYALLTSPECARFLDTDGTLKCTHLDGPRP